MMKKRLCSVLMSVVLVAGMTVAWMPMKALADTQCVYGGADCSADASGTHNHEVTIGTGYAVQTITEGTFNGEVIVKSGGTINGGTFNSGTNNKTVTVESGGKISNGTFNGGIDYRQVVNVKAGGMINGGIFYTLIHNYGTIEDCTSNKTVYNFEGTGIIKGGTYTDHVYNNAGGQITGGTFKEGVSIYGNSTIQNGTFDCDVKNYCGIINGGTYSGSEVLNQGTSGNAIINGGTFKCKVVNAGHQSEIIGGEYYKEVSNSGGKISNGRFHEQVTNDFLNDNIPGTITGGYYALAIINNTGDATKVTDAIIGPLPPLSGGSGNSSDEASGGAHTHSYSWVTVKEVSVGEDGLEEYRCSCGDVAERVVVPAREYYVKQLYGDIRFADENGEVSFDAGSFHTISDYLLTILQSRQDVRLTITFTYKGTSYEAVFTPNTDYTELLNDTEQFYGLLGLNGRYGVTVSAVA